MKEVIVLQGNKAWLVAQGITLRREFPDKVYKVEKALYGLHQAPRAWYETPSTYLLDNGFQRGQIDKTLFIKRVKGDILLVQMSSMGELTFFLGLQVTQKDDGIFISQDKYVDEILKKFGFSTLKTASTPMETSKPLIKDAEAEDVSIHLYRLMIGSLMYLTASRPDIIYLKGQPELGLWYPKDSPFDLKAYTNSDYAGAIFDRKSTIGGCQFLGRRLISWQCKKQTIVANSTTEAEYVAASNETVIKEWEDIMERVATTASSLEAEQESGAKIPYWGGAEAQIRFEAAFKQSNDPPLSRVNTLGSGEDSMKLKDLMEFCTKLSERALDL
ncbi:putative ribonuclease H-like domain-containing protein [Tanacetum coccineum]